jgi:hypothetical protein
MVAKITKTRKLLYCSLVITVLIMPQCFPQIIDSSFIAMIDEDISVEALLI